MTAPAVPEPWQVPVTILRGVGPQLAARLATLNIVSQWDLLLHLPRHYEDRTQSRPIGSTQYGEATLVAGRIEHAEVVNRRQRMLIATLSDGTGQLTLRFFRFHPRQQHELSRGRYACCFGEIRQGPAGRELIHPQYEMVADLTQVRIEPCLTPVYPTTQGLHQATLRRLIQEALVRISRDLLTEWLSAELRQRLDLPTLAEALEVLHRPPPQADLTALTAGHHPARRRLAFEELLAQQVRLVQRRRRVQQTPAPVIDAPGRLWQALTARLPFTVTPAQERVLNDIRADLKRPQAMLRLLQGDVGSGKTLVAAAAALLTVEAGFQAALMAPTELLAEQHFNTLSAWLNPLGVAVALISGRQRETVRETILTAIAKGEAGVVVGTHALFQAHVVFDRLALIIIDEQHRFGVHQRLALRAKGQDCMPHQLVMTATPIPRTLAMMAYADLDSSVIDDMPPGRTPVKTVVIANTRRAEVVERVRERCRQGAQAYWVCTLIEDAEAVQCEAAEQTQISLKTALPELNVGLIHGRLRSTEKQAIMRGFKDGQTDLLVATTVIEVGVDVPNATLMIIENAERLGLAQLHQLRGRVGRGVKPGSCVLLYQPPLSDLARQRLATLRRTTDGFVLAQADLALRGPGELLGARQAGWLGLRVADLTRDQDLLPHVQAVARHLVQVHPERVEPLMQGWLRQGE